jgi:phosphomannomutase
MAAAADWEQGQGSVRDQDVIDAYVDRLVQDFDGAAYKVGWDAGNGAAGHILERLVKKLPGEHHLLYTSRRHVPEPPSRSHRRGEPRRT